MQQQKRNTHAFNTTILLTEMTNLKEVFTYTERELNLAIFNSNVNKTVQTEMYKFLRQVSETREIAGVSTNYNFKNSTMFIRNQIVFKMKNYLFH